MLLIFEFSLPKKIWHMAGKERRKNERGTGKGMAEGKLAMKRTRAMLLLFILLFSSGGY